ncbi:E3 ubiquitin-protein ligase NEDD4-like [Vairimorpha necatrix]|uniref:HECT-type E3 ubiquitin transferase n=1 Tax=Vairimorpha necatrix TaxID=6039 RepID=A0AAX4JEP0_9MICR
MNFLASYNRTVFISLSCFLCVLKQSSTNMTIDENLARKQHKEKIENEIAKFYKTLEEHYNDEEIKLKRTENYDIFCNREDGILSIVPAMWLIDTCDAEFYYHQVKFLKERGKDYGGLLREYFTKANIEYFTADNNLLYSPGGDNSRFIPTKMPKNISIREKNERRLKFQALGTILGLLIQHRATSNFFFAPLIFKILLEEEITMIDLKKVDPKYFNDLLRSQSDEDTRNSCDMRFETDEREDLIPNGQNIKVDETNIEDYVFRYLRYKYVTSIENECNWIKKKLYKVIPRKILKTLSASALEEMIVGEIKIDIEDWKANTEYRGEYNEKSEQIIWFWKFMGELNEKQKSEILYAVTGSYRPPIGGFAKLTNKNKIIRFSIRSPENFDLEAGLNSTKLPWASTCFNVLILPKYPTEEILKKMMTIIVEHGGSFDYVVD